MSISNNSTSKSFFDPNAFLKKVFTCSCSFSPYEEYSSTISSTGVVRIVRKTVEGSSALTLMLSPDLIYDGDKVIVRFKPEYTTGDTRLLRGYFDFMISRRVVGGKEVEGDLRALNGCVKVLSSFMVEFKLSRLFYTVPSDVYERLRVYGSRIALSMGDKTVRYVLYDCGDHARIAGINNGISTVLYSYHYSESKEKGTIVSAVQLIISQLSLLDCDIHEVQINPGSRKTYVIFKSEAPHEGRIEV